MTIRTVLLAVAFLLAAGAGIALACHVMRRPDQATEGPIVTVPDKVITRDRPKPAPTGLSRVFRRRIPPKVEVTAGRPDTTRTRRFGLLVAQRDSLQRVIDSLTRAKAAGDTTARPELVKIPTPLLAPSWGTYDGKRFSWAITRSDGSIMRATARVRPHFEFMAGISAGTDTIPAIVGDRLLTRLVRETPGCLLRAAPEAAAGFGINTENRWQGAAIAGGSALLGCLFK